MAVEFGQKCIGCIVGVILCERGGGSLEIASISEAIGADGTKLRQLEMALVELEYVAADWSVGKRDIVANSTWDDADFVWSNQNVPQLRAYVQYTVLRHDEEIAIGTVKGRVMIHRLPSGKDEHSNSLLHRGISCTSDEFERMNPVDGFVHVKWIPSQLVGYLMKLVVLRIGIVGRCFSRLERRMSCGRKDPVEP